MNTISSIKRANETKRYGITESKKSELDNLSLDVIDAQYNVNKFQSIVNSLTAKAGNFQVFLANAENTRTQTYNNKNLMDQLIQSALDLQNNAKTASSEMFKADDQTKELAKSVKSVIDRLIYASEVLNKLATIIVRKKALNPLISDELMSILATAGKDANNAVALTLIALKSAFAAQASNMESNSAALLVYTQAVNLYEVIIGKVSDGQDEPDDDKESIRKNSVSALIYQAYADARDTYSRFEKALITCTNQLNDAKSELSKAQIRLKSLQSGLAAANAAALAS